MDMQQYLRQQQEKAFTLRVNLVELRGAAKVKGFSVGKDVTFGALRAKIAMTVSDAFDRRGARLDSGTAQ